MQRIVRTAAAVLLAAGVVGALPTVANAVTESAVDPTGDVALGGTYDIKEFGVELTTSTVKATVKTAASLPALSDASWATESNQNGRILVVSIGSELGGSSFVLTGDGVEVVLARDFNSTGCESATENVSGDTITLTAPASCFTHPGQLKAYAVMQRGVNPPTSDVDIAVGPQVTENSAPSDFTSVNVALPGGYYQLGADGGVFAFGNAPFYGSTGNIQLNRPVVGMAVQPDNQGYRFVATDGGVFAYGAAGFYGSMGGQPLNKPVVGMATTGTGNGYWLVASDGGIFAFGDAEFHGSAGSLPLNEPIVGMVPTHTGKGYWLVASDGGIFAYGDAQFYGSTGGMVMNKDVVGMISSTTGNGYLMVAEDGGVFAFGDAEFRGSGVDYFEDDVVAIGRDAFGEGYYLVSASGEVVNFGGALDFGDTSRLGVDLNAPMVGFASTYLVM